MSMQAVFRSNPLLVSILFFSSFFAIYIAESFIPLLSAMGKDLDANHNHIQMTIPVYYFGVMLSQLFTGLLTQRFGRKPLFIFGLAICAFGSVIISLAMNLLMLYVGFWVLAIGTGALTPINTNIVTDVFEKKSMAQIFTVISFGMGAGSIIAPLLSTLIAFHFNWQLSFFITGCIAIIFSVFNLNFLKETNRRYVKKSVLAYLKSAFNLFNLNKKETSFFPPICVFFGLFQSAFIALCANITIILSTQFHRDLSHIGQLFALGSCGYLLGIYICNILSKKFKLIKIIRVGLYLTIINTFAIIIRSYFIPYFDFSQNLLLFWYVVHFLLLNFTFGLVTPTSFTLALAPFSGSEEVSAEASSILMLSANMFTVIVGLAVSAIHVISTMSMAITLLTIFSLAAIIIETFYIHPLIKK
jgi:DHA1 family bicyclomycin/chloramphenicol resistance-like MFS transporter